MAKLIFVIFNGYFYLLAGILLYTFLPTYLPDPLPQNNETLTLHLTELIVIISLMGAGLKIDREFSFKRWASPLKLIGKTMLLCIAITTFLGYYFLGLGLASATLMGAVLAPTDPVLAADVQVGPPNEPGKSETKFVLTSEAGLTEILNAYGFIAVFYMCHYPSALRKGA